MSDIRVQTGSTDYTVHIGRNLLPGIATRARALLGEISQAFLVTSPEIERHWSAPVREAFAAAGVMLHTLRIPPGEAHKRLATVERLLEEMAELRADRDSLVIALGGGVIGDMAGFLAATYMRGVPYVQVPTTLLAQVDSSVGGKTGVNLRAGKNLAGAFYQPAAVFADLDTLATLPHRELLAGLQECIKAGILRDAALFRTMETNTASIRQGDRSALQPVIEASVQIKADVVAEDEHEAGLRMILNLGHTVGHAIEAATHYTGLLHGEAVGWGMIAATRLAQRRGVLDAESAHRILALIHAYGPLPAFQASVEQLVLFTGSDKKMRSGTLSFILPVAIGQVEIVRDVTGEELRSAVTEMLQELPAEHAVPA